MNICLYVGQPSRSSSHWSSPLLGLEPRRGRHQDDICTGKEGMKNLPETASPWSTAESMAVSKILAQNFI